jgi:hypothetical protein
MVLSACGLLQKAGLDNIPYKVTDSVLKGGAHDPCRPDAEGADLAAAVLAEGADGVETIIAAPGGSAAGRFAGRALGQAMTVAV